MRFTAIPDLKESVDLGYQNIHLEYYLLRGRELQMIYIQGCDQRHRLKSIFTRRLLTAFVTQITPQLHHPLFLCSQTW